MKNNKRTFLDYYMDYSDEGFYDYGKMFLNWTKVFGYIPTHFSNMMFIYSDFSIEKLFNSHLKYLNMNEDINRQRVEFESDINLVGYRSEIFIDNQELLKNKKNELEVEFCNSFIEIICPKANYNRNISENSIDEVINEFETVLSQNMMRDKINELESFLFDFDMFLNKIPNSKPKGSNEYGYFLLKNINHYWQDVGVIIYNKSDLSREILFYQIGDDN